jgi:diaminopimelate epimerase
MTLALTKHHGLGNDFLVLIDLDGAVAVDGDLARAACDRTTGVGADGFIRARRTDGADVAMELWNADGSTAELSGNGLRCLGQALVLAGVVDADVMTVATAKGRHDLSVEATDDPAVHDVVADMGAVELEGRAGDWVRAGVADAAFARIENPHLVLHVPSPEHGPDLDEIGAEANEVVPGGVNVELIRASGDDLVLTVYERGAGRTQACGTGACAAATVARDWGLVGDQVAVHMPGGTARIGLGDTVTLAGPVVAVARVEWPWR